MATKPIRTLLARALYNNQSEFPTELAFSRGDVVTVLERDPEGYEGWWICSLKGKVGIAPGNRFEVLGSISKPKSDQTDDVYDDPREWTTPDPVTRIHQTIPSAMLHGMGTYENLESVKPSSRTSGLTDSGNYSNRSSDVSLSLQSVTGATLTGSAETKIQRKTPDSQFEDYEDLDLDSTQSYKLDFDWSTRALPPVPHISTNPIRRHTPCSTKHSHGTTYLKQASSGKSDYITARSPVTDSLNKSTTSTKELASTNLETLNQYTADAENQSVMSTSSVDFLADTEILRSGFLKDQQEILAALRSRSAFVHFLSPIKQRIEAHGKRVLSSIQTSRSTGSIDTTACTYNLARLVQDLAIVHQTCVLLTTSSKESPDAGLTRKFLLLRKTAEDVIARLSSIVRELEVQNSVDNKRTPSVGELPRLVQLVSQTVESLDTTVLANASLLFTSTKILRRTNSTSRPHAPDSGMETMRTLSNSVPQLNQLGTAEVSAGLEEVQRLGPQQFKAFEAGIQSLKRQCENSSSVAQQFLKELQSHDWSPRGKRQEKALLTPSFLTLQVKNTLHQSSLLIRAIAEFCSTIGGGSENHSALDKNSYLRKIAMELEHRGSAICEALKGLVIQAKEATSHLRNETPQTSGCSTVPSTLCMPGPLWQRLLGSTRSVCMSLTALDKILSSYLITTSK